MLAQALGTGACQSQVQKYRLVANVSIEHCKSLLCVPNKFYSELRVQVPHPADVLELLGAHVVSVHDEALVVSLQQVAELGVVLRNTKKTLSGSQTPVSLPMTSLYHSEHTGQPQWQERTSSFLLSLLVEGIFDRLWDREAAQQGQTGYTTGRQL